MQSKQKTRWWVDASLFAGLITACFVNLTGVDMHQWIGVLAGAIALYHLLTHLNWIEVVTERFFGKTSAISRVYYLIDAGLMAGFFSMIATGLVMSTWLNLDLSNYATWRTVHIGATIASVSLTFVKLILHRSWIVQTARKWVFPSPLSTAPAAPAAPGGMSRREFLATMGTVSLASLLALGQSIDSLNASSQEAASTAASTSTTSSSSQSSASKIANITSSTTTCALLCGKRCSYPGRCRRYTDSNANGRCDLGECAA
jgi:hypothetical protein